MDTPGPFETHATEAYFNVTLPDPSMTPAQVEGYMHAFNVGTVISTAVHEAYPGHYVQFLWVPQAPSRVRKLLGANTNVEGWAHYCEQMMLDEGYGQPGAGAKDEREAKFLRLGQLQDALLRDARFIVGIEMHTGKMSFDAGDRVLREGGLSVAGDGAGRNQARHRRPDLSLLHAGQARDHEAARRSEEESRARRSRWRNFTTNFCARAFRRSRSCARRCWATNRRRL